MTDNPIAAHYTRLLENLGDAQGYGRGETFGDEAWDTHTERTLRVLLAQGLSDFYEKHDWTFLRPFVTLTLPAAGTGEQSVLDLPHDAGGVEGKLYLSGDSGYKQELDFGPPGLIERQYALYPDQSGQPCHVCVEPVKGTTVYGSSRQRLRFWPRAGAAYTVRFQVYINQEFLSGVKPYAYGGPQHFGTILQSCLAAAERRDGVRDGPQELKYREKLRDAIQIDSRHLPQHYGYNGDRPDREHRPYRRIQMPTVTIGGS